VLVEELHNIRDCKPLQAKGKLPVEHDG